MCSMRMSRPPSRNSQSPGKSPGPTFAMSAKMLAQLPISESASKLSELGRDSELDRISIRKPLEMKGFLRAPGFRPGARKPNKRRHKPGLDAQESRKKSRTFAYRSPSARTGEARP